MAKGRLATLAEGRDPLVFAENVRRIREHLGWSRQRLCEEAGISPQTLTKIERGNGCMPTVERKLAAALYTIEGRLWEKFALDTQLIHSPASDRWYFANPEEGIRYRERQGLEGPLRMDPDSIQDDAERNRLGWTGLSCGFVRVTTAHLLSGTVISSVLDVFGTIESNVPDGHLAYFHVLQGAIRFQIGTRVHELSAGDVLQAQMESPSAMSLRHPIANGELPARVVYVDLVVKPRSP
jgi:transcriptional regulator with XRE-family HTH domain